MPSPITQKPAGLIRATERGTRMVAALIGAVLTILIGHQALLRMGNSLVSLSYDIPFFLRRGGGEQETKKQPVRIVYLSENDGARLDRKDQARLLDKLGEVGVKAVVYDLIFDVPSDDPSIDEEFAAAILRFRGVDENWEPIPGIPQRHVVLACGRKNFNVGGMSGEQLIPPIDILLGAADNFGLVNIEHDAYFSRKLSTGTADEPSLGWNTAQLLGAELDEETRTDKKWINFAGRPANPKDPQSAPPIFSMGSANVFDMEPGSDLLQDKVVVIGGEPGVVGAELGVDLFVTPYHRLPFFGSPALTSGVEIQANSLANLLEGNWLTRSTERFDNTLVIIAGIIIGAGLTFLRPLRGVIVAITLILASVVAGTLTHLNLFWFPWSVVAFAQVPVGLVWGVASHSYIERFFRMKLTAEQKAIRAAFAKYLSPQMLDRLTLEGFTTNLGGEKVQAAMMFTDLEGFTDMSERLADPERIVETLNDYFERTTGSIFDHDGIIVSFIGDAIFAAWGAPLADPQAPIKAVRAAWNLNQNDKLVVDGQVIRTRIGLHTGEVVAGNLGSNRRIDYTLIGDAVNLSARLEGINKLFGTSILLSGSIHEHLNGEFLTRRVGKFTVKGRKEVVVVHELLGPSEGRTLPDWVITYHQALDLLEGNHGEEALNLFEKVKGQREANDDGPSKYFIEQIQAGIPMKDGTVVLKEK